MGRPASATASLCLLLSLVGCAAHSQPPVPSAPVRTPPPVVEAPITLTLAPATAGPDSPSTFRVTGAATALAWTDLAAANVLPLPPLSGGEQDPGRPHRRVTCKSGSALPAKLQDPPRLMVTADDGATWRTISLAGVALGSQADMAGCRAVSLDPNAVDTFYVAGGGHMGAYDWDRDPAPLYTADGGKSWRRIPAPDGYGQPGQFIGFTVTPDRVTTWFGKPESEQPRTPATIAGSATADGGKTWTTVPLTCPASSPCAWNVPSLCSGERAPAPADGWYQLRRGSATWEPAEAPAQPAG